MKEIKDRVEVGEMKERGRGGRDEREGLKT